MFCVTLTLCIKVKVKMYFLVNASPPNPLNVAASIFAAAYGDSSFQPKCYQNSTGIYIDSRNPAHQYRAKPLGSYL